MRPGLAHARPSLLRHLNERAVFTTLQSRGPCSRADIARFTGISGPTVTRAVAALLEARLLEEDEPQQAGLGRPGKTLRLARNGVGVVGAVIGSVQCEVVLAGLDGHIDPDNIRLFDTPSSYSALIDALASETRDLLASSATSPLSLGVSVPGLLDSRAGRSLVSPNVPQTNGRLVGDDLRAALELETTLLQECDALCLAEQVYGAARETDDFAMLDISEGLGLGVVQGGRLIDGHSGLAGELGHVTVDLHGRRCGCGNTGCLETVATDTAFLHAVAERIHEPVSMAQLLGRAMIGELDPEPELSSVLEYLAVGVAAVINIFNPSKIFIYGRLFDAAPGVFDRLEQLTAGRALGPSMADCRLIRARGNKRLGAIAGAIQTLTLPRTGKV